jgi:hypothetical protein
MPFDNLLGELLDAAFQSLSEKFEQDDNDYDSVKLIVDHSLGDTFTFLLYNCEDNCRWERKNWYKQNDISKISNLIDSLQYIGQKIIPNIIEQQGITTLEGSKELFLFVNSLLELDSNEKSNKIVIDGTEYLLQIKLKGIQKEFKWKAIPNGWRNVEILTNKIIELNNKIY